MSEAQINSMALQGLLGVPLTVDVKVSAKPPGWVIVGMPAGSVRDARERIGAAIVASGYQLPPRHYDVTFEPASLVGGGPAQDLPVALAALAATGQVEASALARVFAFGELGLDGTVRPIRGVLSRLKALYASLQPEDYFPRVVLVPAENAEEAALLPWGTVTPVRTLQEAVAALAKANAATTPKASAPVEDVPCFSEVQGQPLAKRALEIAAAGGHHLLLVGPPGAGKTMLARRLPSIMPPLSDAELQEVVEVHSVAGILFPNRITSRVPPFRAPHHTISLPGLVGGGHGPRPGEVSLAHRGVLFLDEVAELPRYVVDGLRQPLTDRAVTMARASTTSRFPARFLLVGAMDPCPCGQDGEPSNRCRCSTTEIVRYRARVEALRAHTDLYVRTGAVKLASLMGMSTEETSATIRERVLAARARQAERFASLPGVTLNADAPGRWMVAHGNQSQEAEQLMREEAVRRKLSAEQYHRVFKVARTIADLEASMTIEPVHVTEALSLFAGTPPLERENADRWRSWRDPENDDLWQVRDDRVLWVRLGGCGPWIATDEVADAIAKYAKTGRYDRVHEFAALAARPLASAEETA